MKKYIEIFIVIFIISSFVYTIFYIFFFGNICSKYSMNENMDIRNMAKCSHRFICEISDRDIKNNKLESWKCSKKRVDMLELEYYKNILQNLIK